jgi:hypothetical protein
MDAPFQGFGNHRRLLEDFLEHEMAVTAFARCAAHLAGVGQGPFHRVAVPVINGEAFALHFGDIAFFQKDEGLRDRHQGENIRGDEMLLDADAQHQRAAGPRRDQRSGSSRQITPKL